MKKLFSLLIAVIMIFSVIPVMAISSSAYRLGDVCRTADSIQEKINGLGINAHADIICDEEYVEITKTIYINKPCTLHFLSTESKAVTFNVKGVRAFEIKSDNVNLYFSKGSKMIDVLPKKEGLSLKDGWGIYIKGDRCLVDGLKFEGLDISCRAKKQNAFFEAYDGAGVYVNGKDCRINNCIFSHCYASGDGGGICVNKDNCRITNCKFDICTAEKDGGAIYINRHSDKCVIKDCSFDFCEAGEDGGRLGAAGRGGAIALGAHVDDCEIVSCTFSECSAHKNGQIVSGNKDTKIVACIPETQDSTLYESCIFISKRQHETASKIAKSIFKVFFRALPFLPNNLQQGIELFVDRVF